MKLKGSYTVEAALLMVLVIPLLAGIIYMGFYLHNGAAMQNAAYELAALGSLHYGEKEREEIIKERKREIGSQLFLGIQGIEAEIHIGKKKITADANPRREGQAQLCGFSAETGWKSEGMQN